VKYFSGTNTPADDHDGDQQNCCNQQADIQPEEGKNQQSNQRKGAHPHYDGKGKIIEMTGNLIQHGNSPGTHILSHSTAMVSDA